VNVMEEKIIARLQDNLVTIRHLLGWSAEKLGEGIGVSKQTISNMENKRSPITMAQYMAIRTIIENEINSRSDEEKIYLTNAISLLLDENDSLKKEEREKAISDTKVIAAATAGGAGVAAVTALAGSLSIGSAGLLPVVAAGFAGPAGLAVGAAIGASIWLPKLMKKNDKNRKDGKKNGKKN